jgi:hypothetical protein
LILEAGLEAHNQNPNFAQASFWPTAWGKPKSLRVNGGLFPSHKISFWQEHIHGASLRMRKADFFQAAKLVADTL